jgi:DNA-binding response OmpR family regulator
VSQSEGYHTVIVSASNDLLPAVRAAGPALVLRRVQIAHARTFTVVRGLRSDESLETVPVAVTAGRGYRQESVDAGANAFLGKPLRPLELLALKVGWAEG